MLLHTQLPQPAGKRHAVQLRKPSRLASRPAKDGSPPAATAPCDCGDRPSGFARLADEPSKLAIGEPPQPPPAANNRRISAWRFPASKRPASALQCPPSVLLRALCRDRMENRLSPRFRPHEAPWPRGLRVRCFSGFGAGATSFAAPLRFIHYTLFRHNILCFLRLKNPLMVYSPGFPHRCFSVEKPARHVYDPRFSAPLRRGFPQPKKPWGQTTTAGRENPRREPRKLGVDNHSIDIAGRRNGKPLRIWKFRKRREDIRSVPLSSFAFLSIRLPTNMHSPSRTRDEKGVYIFHHSERHSSPTPSPTVPSQMASNR